MIRLILATAALATLGASEPPVITGVDHIPTVVRDLDRAVSDMAALGFVLKPGRPHANGLRNAHIKFADGSYLEFISPAGPTDALASDYVRWLRGGDGPAYVGFNAPDRAALLRNLRHVPTPGDEGGMLTFPTASPLHQFFFVGRRDPASTDRPEHYAHANTAFSVGAVWIAATRAQRDALIGLGWVGRGRPCGPFPPGTKTTRLTGGEIVLLPPDARHADRAIVGATILVRNLATAAAILKRNHVGITRVVACPRSLWVKPATTHGLVLQFRQPSPGWQPTRP